MSAPPIRVRGLTVGYAGRPALRSLDLEVPAGQILALTGPNGSGKTTLLRTLLGFLAPSEGTVEIFGQEVGSLSPRERARRVAWVPQDEPLRDDVPLLEYVLYGRYARHGRFEGDSAADRALARRLLREVGLADREEDGVASISGGERQRAILARALAQEAPVLLLDEPTTHLDIGHQLDLLERTRRRARSEGVTVIAALHDLNLAARYADRVLVLSHGRRAAEGAPGDVLSEALLARVWGIDARRVTDPASRTPYLLPLRVIGSAAVRTAPGGGGAVHVIGGGGTATPLLHDLVEAGFDVTVGALHLLDTDTETAEALALPASVELPFAPFSEPVRARHRELLRGARVVLVAPFPVGPGNLASLEDLQAIVPAARVVLLEPPDERRTDFVDGRAEAIRTELRGAGAVVVASAEAAIGAVHRLSALPAAGSAASGPVRAEDPELGRGRVRADPLPEEER